VEYGGMQLETKSIFRLGIYRCKYLLLNTSHYVSKTDQLSVIYEKAEIYENREKMCFKEMLEI